MVSTTSQINKVVEFIAVLGDLIILNLCLFFLLFFWEEVFVSLPFSCRVSWMMTSLSLCYLACSASRGRAWNSRAIRADQLVVRVLKNIIIFSVFWACIMAFSGISIISPLFFIIYFFILFVVLSVYRIIIRRLLIDYCAKGKHKSYAVFIGGGDNMRTLYEEMESSLAAIYEVVGYFDVTPNDTFSSQCRYLGNPDNFADFMSGKTSVKHVFCSLAMDEGHYNVPIINYCENHLLYFHGVPNVCKGFPQLPVLSLPLLLPELLLLLPFLLLLLLLLFLHLHLLHAGCCLYLLTRFMTSSANSVYSFALLLDFLYSTTGTLLSWDHSTELSTRITCSNT